MPCALVEAVEVGISGALLDDEDALAEAQQLIELTCRQLVETPPFRRDLRHAGLSSHSRRRPGSRGRGWRARSRSSPAPEEHCDPGPSCASRLIYAQTKYTKSPSS